MVGCAKGEKPAAAADSSNMMMMSDSSHMMVSDSSKMTMAPPDPQMSADSTSVERGKTLYHIRGCDVCHNIPHPGRMSGPDLGGVTDRRTREWLTRFLKDTEQMLASDPIATAMLKKWNNVKMPTVKLSDAEIEALLNYLATKH